MEPRNSKSHNGWIWARITSELLGWPVLIILVCKGVAMTFFTLTCQTASWRCEYALTSPAQLITAAQKIGTEAPTIKPIANQPVADEEIDRLRDEVTALSRATHTMASELGFLDPTPAPAKKKN